MGRIQSRGDDVTVTVEVKGDGVMTSEPAGIDCGSKCSSLFVRKSNVLLQASVETMERLLSYTGDCTDRTECILNMDGDKHVIATFLTALTTTVTGQGRITSSPGTVDCNSSCKTLFDPTVAVTLRAEALPGFQFTGWSGACSGSAATCSVTVDTAKTVGATFTANAVPDHQLTVSITGNASGTVTTAPTGINCPGRCDARYAENTVVTLTAAPTAGATFAGWSGACSGTQLTCQIPMDIDHTVTARFVTQTRCGYSKRFGGIGSDFSGALQLGPGGQYALAGTVYGNVNFGGGALTGPSNRSMAFAAVFDSDGNYLSAFGKGAASAVTIGQSAAVLPDGKVMVSGLFSGAVNLGLGTVDDGIDAGQALWRSYVGKYNTAGDADWVNLLGAGYQRNSGSGAMVVDDQQNVTVVGEFALPDAFGSGTTRTPVAGTDIYIAQFSTAGAFNWLKVAGGPQDDHALCVSRNGAGDVFVGGDFTGPADFQAGTPFSTAQNADGFTARYQRSGLGIASTSIGSDAGYSDSVHATAFGPSGEQVVVGVYEGTMSLAGRTLSSAGSDDAFVEKLDANGTPLWAVSMGGSMWDSGDTVALDSAGNIYVAGTFGGAFSIGSNTINSRGDIDIFVAKFAPNGDLISLRGFGGTGLDWVSGAAVDGNDKLHLFGSFSESIDFGFGAMNAASTGFTDIFFVCLP